MSGDGEDKGKIRREAKEISPRYNGHKVTIQVHCLRSRVYPTKV